MDYKWFDVNNLLLSLVHWCVHESIYFTLNFDVARVWYVFLSILLVLENLNFTSLRSPWKVHEFCPFSLLWTLLSTSGHCSCFLLCKFNRWYRAELLFAAVAWTSPHTHHTNTRWKQEVPSSAVGRWQFLLGFWRYVVVISFHLSLESQVVCLTWQHYITILAVSTEVVRSDIHWQHRFICIC